MDKLKHFKHFESENDYETYMEGNPILPNISFVGEESSVHYKQPHDYSRDYLTFKITGDGNIRWKAQNTAYTATISYSKDNGKTWTDITSDTGDSAPSISVVSGNIVLFKANNVTYNSGSSRYNYFSGTTCQFKVEGNIMSLLYSDDFIDQITLPNSAYTFSYLFNCCTGLTSVKNLILPATTITQNCYAAMFSGCTSLTTAPELPATNLNKGYSCYEGMFSGCRSLTTPPSILPATTLVDKCYSSMFENCTSLTTTPELPATTLKNANYCYEKMFSNCTSLTTAPELPATTLKNSNYCYSYMFAGCTSLTTVPELPATTLTPQCYYRMFSGCRSLTTIPSNLLPATTLANECYNFMFSNCTSLTTAPELPATTLKTTCYYRMFENCTSLTTAPELPATTLVESCYFGMFENCSSLNYIKCLATDISANACTCGWINGVQIKSGTFIKASGTDWSGRSVYDGIPKNWTVQDAE